MSDYRIVKHRGSLSIRYYIEGGQRIRRALGTNDRGLGEFRAKQIWDALQTPSGDRIEDIWHAYARDKKVDGIKVDKSGSTWKALAPSFGQMLAPALSRDDCR